MDMHTLVGRYGLLGSSSIRPILIAPWMFLLGRAALAQETCGSVPTPDQVAEFLGRQLANLYALPPWVVIGSTQFDVPVAFHIVQRDDGSEGFDPLLVPQALQDLSAGFDPLGINYFQPGPIIFHRSDAFFFQIDSRAEIDDLRNTGSVPNALNIYITPNLEADTASGTDLNGTSTFTHTEESQGIVMESADMDAASAHSVLVHEAGHYLDLLHTFETAVSSGCTSGFNCLFSGDLICDTPADIDPTGMGVIDAACNWTGTQNGPCLFDPPYDPDTHNFMSYAPPACLDHFTDQQRARMVAALILFRSSHLNPEIFVDFSHNGPENGSPALPFNTTSEGLQMLAAGGTLRVQAGSSGEALTIRNTCTIVAMNGFVTIGQ